MVNQSARRRINFLLWTQRQNKNQITFVFFLSACAATFRHTKTLKPIHRRNIFRRTVQYDTSTVFSWMTNNLIWIVRINSTCQRYVKCHYFAAQMFARAQLQVKYWSHLADTNINEILTAFCHSWPDMTEELLWWKQWAVSKAHRHTASYTA